MSLGLNTNLSSLNAQRHLTSTQAASQTAMARLSSGLRVNSAKDDAAGLAIGSKMEAQVRGLNQAVRNANDGVSMLQTADGGLQTVSNIFQRMRELAVQAANGDTMSTTDLGQLDKEYQALSGEVTRIAGNTQFNGISLLDNTGGKAVDLQVGANNGGVNVDAIQVNLGDATQYLATPGNLNSKAAANTAIGALDNALDSLNGDRAVYGSALSQLDFTVSNLQNASENQTAAKSRIMDADYSAESANLAKAQVLQQAGIAMVAQANQQPQQILSLLR